MSQFTPYSIYGIIGYPLGHSMSPLIHTTSFQDYGIPAVLVPFATPPQEIATLFKSVRLLNIRGLCVTIPHKQTIIPYLDEVTEHVKKAGAANLVYWRGDKLCGDNTDIVGFMEPLKNKKLPAEYNKVLLLGAGGAARAAVVGLQDLGYTNITVTDIVDESAQILANEFNLKIIKWEDRSEVEAQIIINSTPLGMTGKFEDQTPYDQAWFKGKGVAYDIVYTPYNTRFRQEAEQAGWESISGREMFIGQANAQFKIWTGKDLSERAKQAVIDALTKK
ncbi:shikimate dehydrogenase [Gilliamella sp. Pra-s65]|uniref:shikimate dehydrogenase n=1 Tax=unclassified Gilliamella TaxID=2685620 RepID=UPI00132B4773|nr:MULTISPECIES: shikimate dehydrogenase [unclassified Gilliamella]MWN31690.1 shikimate dehydrogenase [Gilliamella sp. Pra-s60]MWN90759.1 shikimate dehydrogenase [Gilliamella sp. Pra-s65]MWP28797.1 shikimate dehydrogenase [Gilliamella sp. Pra-s54]MWP46827.1 shikimate dehydrogenase [Gilliamella sp. Pas-s27]MWP72080.1 shikimate dehydrogenase [Gilliamella sp. Pra-s52]